MGCEGLCFYEGQMCVTAVLASWRLGGLVKIMVKFHGFLLSYSRFLSAAVIY